MAAATANGDQMLEFDHIFQEIRGMMYPGKLRLRQADIFFKNEKTGRIDHYSSADIEKVHWIIRARGFCLKFMLGDLIYRYDGFKEADFDRLHAFARTNWQIEIEKQDLAYKGWNWGQLNFVKNALELEVSGHTAFELPLNNVANVGTGKQEVTLEFHQNDDAEVCLMEMRFHIGDRSELQCEEVAKRIMDKADIIQLTGDALCEFKELYCVQPRGRYDFRFYPTFLHMHGKTFDYKIPISTIYRMFVLPHADGRQNFLVLGLEPPIKHGQTRYHFLILLFDVDVETSVELRCTEEELQTKYGGKLQKEMNGKEFEVISRLCRVLVNRKITVPGSFRSKSGGHYISCGYKANTGFLYPLDRGFIFVPKPPMHVRFEEISSVQFSRGTASVRSFDFEINTKAGVNFTFNSVEKDEYTHLYKFVQDKQLPVKNIGEEDTTGKLEAWESSEAESDGDDVYMKRVKAEGKERTASGRDGGSGSGGGGGGGGGGESSDDSEDEDFLPPEASGSEVEEEYDTDADPSEFSSDTDYSDEEARKKKKRRLAKTVPEEGFGDYTEKKKKKAQQKEAKAARSSKVSSKDRNAPKRPASAYFLFLEDERPNIKADQPDLKVTEIGRVAGERWAKLDEARKKAYQERAEALKLAYQADLAEYQGKLDRGEVQPDIQQKRKSAGGGGKGGGDKSGEKSGGGGGASSSAAGSGANYKSAEFINDSDVSSVSSSSSSSDEEAEDQDDEEEEEAAGGSSKAAKRKQPKDKPKEKPKASKKKKASSSEEEEEDEEEESGSGSDSE